MQKVARLLSHKYKLTVRVVCPLKTPPVRTKQKEVLFFLVPPPSPPEPGHWVCLVGLGDGYVIALDSCSSRSCGHNTYVQREVIKYSDDPSLISLYYQPCPQQPDNTSCGYYAAANDAYLLHSHFFHFYPHQLFYTLTALQLPPLLLATIPITLTTIVDFTRIWGKKS